MIAVAAPLRNRPSRVVRAVTAVLALAVLAADVWVITQHDRSTPIDVESALARFRESSSAPATNAPAGTTPTSAPTSATPTTEVAAPPTPGDTAPPTTATTVPPQAPTALAAPAPGVYTYTTIGREQLGVSTHEYPATTPAIVTHDGACGWLFDHQVLQEHTDRYHQCNDASSALTGWDLHRAFFGVSMDEVYTCTGPALLDPARAPGTEIGVRCDAQDEDAIDLALVDLGTEDIAIGGQVVRAQHLRGTGTFSGNPDGSATLELWLHRDTGLRLREIRTLDARVSAGGASSSYREEAEFVLQSLEPQR